MCYPKKSVLYKPLSLNKMRKRRFWGVEVPVLLALLFGACTLLLTPADPEEEVPQVDDGMFHCFCARPAHDQTNNICLWPAPSDDTENLAQGTGNGLFPELTPSDAWSFDGNNPDEGAGTVQTLYLTVYGDTIAGDEIVVEYDDSDNTLMVRARDGSWELDNPLQLCEE